MGDPRCYCPGAARPDECGRVGAAVRVLLPNGQGGRGTDVLVGAANPRGHSPLHALALSRTANGADDPSETVRALGGDLSLRPRIPGGAGGPPLPKPGPRRRKPPYE